MLIYYIETVNTSSYNNKEVNMLRTAVGFKDVKIIDSCNTDMCYAVSLIERRTKEAEKDGWERFGPITPIYDAKEHTCMFIQILTK